jgi:hypothetical protein
MCLGTHARRLVSFGNGVVVRCRNTATTTGNKPERMPVQETNKAMVACISIGSYHTTGTISAMMFVYAKSLAREHRKHTPAHVSATRMMSKLIGD